MKYDFYIFRKNHELPGQLQPRHLDDGINVGKPDLERVVLTYKIGSSISPIFTVDDLLHGHYNFNAHSESSFRGEMMERISRRLIKRFLKYYSPDGKRAGTLGPFNDEFKRNNYTLEFNEQYELKTRNYPNAVLIEKKWDEHKKRLRPRDITDLDGLFFYHFDDEQHLFIVESKAGKWGYTPQRQEKIVRDLIKPLKSLYPDWHLNYLMMSAEDALYHPYRLSEKQIDALPKQHRKYIGQLGKVKRLNPQAVELYERLTPLGVNTMFFTFNETPEKIKQVKEFLIGVYEKFTGMQGKGRFKGSFEDTVNRTAIYNGAPTPDIEFVLNSETGEYRKITHGFDVFERLHNDALAAHQRRVEKKASKDAARQIIS